MNRKSNVCPLHHLESCIIPLHFPQKASKVQQEGKKSSSGVGLQALEQFITKQTIFVALQILRGHTLESWRAIPACKLLPFFPSVGCVLRKAWSAFIRDKQDPSDPGPQCIKNWNFSTMTSRELKSQFAGIYSGGKRPDPLFKTKSFAAEGPLAMQRHVEHLVLNARSISRSSQDVLSVSWASRQF